MAKLYYQGHASLRFVTDAGKVIYVDPFAGSGYDLPADLILVTHDHGDHNQIGLCAKKPDCRIITQKEALAGGSHQTFELGFVTVRAVEANNKNHSPESCVGYLLTLDGVTVYCVGDTSKTAEMSGLAALNIDYALLPGDGIFNMNLTEAAECAEIIGAKHNIPIHLKPPMPLNKNRYSRKMADGWTAPNKLIVDEATGEIT
jgi:L-ascorbate metabolism protein UlaG (beta-lactamase superfamily)